MSEKKLSQTQLKRCNTRGWKPTFNDKEYARPTQLLKYQRRAIILEMTRMSEEYTQKEQPNAMDHDRWLRCHENKLEWLESHCELAGHDWNVEVQMQRSYIDFANSVKLSIKLYSRAPEAKAFTLVLNATKIPVEIRWCNTTLPMDIQHDKNLSTCVILSRSLEVTKIHCIMRCKTKSLQELARMLDFHRNPSDARHHNTSMLVCFFVLEPNTLKPPHTSAKVETTLRTQITPVQGAKGEAENERSVKCSWHRF